MCHETRLKNTAFNDNDSNTLKVYLQFNQTILALKMSVFQNLNTRITIPSSLLIGKKKSV